MNSIAARRQICLGFFLSLACARAGAAEVDVSKLPPPAGVQVNFSRDIQPIFETSCLRCHGPEKPKSKFRLDNRVAALKGGDDGVDILPGNSAKSPLIHYVAGLVEDMEMPPQGKGKKPTTQQISLLRAWIDQGAVWSTANPTNSADFTLSTIFGGTSVSGDKHKFREHYWQKEGPNGGIEQFELFEQTGPDTRLLMTGHALVDDYKVEFDVDRNELGFVHAGWEDYRKYFDDSGLYDPFLVPTAPRLREDLHLEIGKAWIDFGLALPDWPLLVFGYEYDYKKGNEAMTQYGNVGTRPNTARNIDPASKAMNEHVHIIKFDLNHEIGGVSVEDRFRGEFYVLRTDYTNVAFGQIAQKVNEGTSYFQGANTLRLEKKFNDWFFASAGYLFSKMDADSSFNLDYPTRFQTAGIPSIALERDSRVGNLNGLFGPFDGLTISTAAQAEWTHQHGFGLGTLDQRSPPPPPFTDTIVPFYVASDYDETSVKENLALRYSKIPFTSVFAEARLQEEKIGQFDQFSSSQDIINKAVFLQRTAFSSLLSDARAGFNTSPWRVVTLSGHVRRYEDDSHYNSDALVQPVQTAYPTFIRSRDLLTDEVEGRIALRPATWFKTSVTYQYQKTDYQMDTLPFVSFGNVISPGGPVSSGEDASQTVSLNATFTPSSRLYLSSTFSWQTFDAVTADQGSPAVAPYRGDTYSALADATFVLDESTDLFVNYAFSQSDYAQNNFVAGVPIGIEYQRHSTQVGLAHRFNKRVSAKLQYRYDYYDEPTSGGAANYRANAAFCIFTFRFR
ncbi:MAG TPA: c-type cytochrome domain-containing protein [Verrucomicrobiae bacterium]|nr:c-type cytochrome domain-containing protein [Verrucomicrobiae bacterium]